MRERDLYIYMYICIWHCMLVCMSIAYGRYVRNTLGRYSIRYAKYIQYVESYWTSFWSPSGSR